MIELMRWLGLSLLMIGMGGLLIHRGWVGRVCSALGMMVGFELFLVGLGKGLLGVGSAYLACVAFFSLFITGYALLLKGRRQ